jgi:dephospho-CoA kinase
VLDAPLVIEAGLNRLCDVMVFVDAPRKARLARVAKERGWDEAELKRREKRQKPLDYKRKSADFLIRNTLSRKNTLAQVRRLYNHIRQASAETKQPPSKSSS